MEGEASDNQKVVVDLDQASKEVLERPITHSEMQALLEPLRICLQRMESTMDAALSSSASAGRGLVGSDGHANLADVDIWVENGRDHDVEKEPAVTPSMDILPEPKQDLLDVIEHPAIGMIEDEPQAKPGIALKRHQSCYNVEEDEVEGGDVNVEFVEHLKIDQELKASHFGKEGGRLDKTVYQGMDVFLAAMKILKEPERHGWLNMIASSKAFETTCIIAITFNSVLVAYVADWQIRHFGESEPVILTVLEIGCLVFFTIELIIRLGAHRCHFFVNSEMHWNIFDFVLVSISLVDLVLDKILQVGTGGNVGFMRLLRLLKLARIFRSLRSFRFFKSLAVLLESFQKSFDPLFWGMIMLGFVLYLFSLIFMQALLDCLSKDDLASEDRLKIMTNFGSLDATLITLYMSVTGGDDWSGSYDIICCAGALYGLLFIFFTFVLQFALFNILTGSLVEKAMSSSKPDRADRVLSQRRLFAEQRHQFMEICKAMDSNCDDRISWDEFKDCMTNSAVLSYMASIGIEVHDVELFFGTVAQTEHLKGEIPIRSFVDGCMHMKGHATAIDMQRQMLETRTLLDNLRQFSISCAARFEHLERLIVQDGKYFKQKLGNTSKEPLKESDVKLSI